MPKADDNGVEIEWDQCGKGATRRCLLIMGLGSQMTRWSEDFMAALIDRITDLIADHAKAATVPA